MSECCQEPREGSPESLARLCGPNPAGRQLNVAQHLAVALLWLYKTAVSPLLMSCCKFHPTCSAYAREAIERHGFLRGSRMAAGRVLRCRPFAPGGFDPVPE